MSRDSRDLPLSAYRAVFDASVDGVLIIDAAGVIRDMNGAAAELFGYEREELVGRNVSVLMEAPDANRHDGYMNRYLEGGAPRIIGRGRDVHGRRKDGATFPFRLSVSETSVAGERLFAGIIHDLTQLTRLRASADQNASLAAIGEHTASVAHEIKNPIAAISAGLQALRAGMGGDERRRRIVDMLLDRLFLLDDTVRRLLAFAKHWTPEVKPTPVRALAQALDQAAQNDPTFEGVRLEVSPEAMRAEVPCDPGLVAQVLHNLALNAAQAMSAGGTLRLHHEVIADTSVLTLSDDGPGIPAAAVERLFEPFFTTRAAGTGLGLPICRRIMEAHGGTIEVASIVGDGTSVVLSFPRV